MNQTPNTTTVPPMPPKEGGMSGIIAIVVIIALLAVGGVYYLMTNSAIVAEETLPTLEEAQNSDDPAVQAALTQNSSDELSAIEADVSATDFADIDAAISELDSQ